MESPSSSPLIDSVSGQSSRSRSSMKLNDDVTSLTSFNPFSEEDEHDQSSYTLVTSILSRVKNSLSAPLTAAATTTSNMTTTNNTTNAIVNGSEARRPTYTTIQTNSSNFSSRTSASERPNPLAAAPAQAAPPLVSLTPAQSELPTYTVEYDRGTSQKTPYSPGIDLADNAPFGTSIPGFPIQDDARSIKTATSIHRSGSVSKVMRRLRGEGLSRDYWMDDENCKECYDCKSIFTTWRRKHHCRICGQIFCSRCASNIIKGARFGSEGMVRVCNLCLEKLAKVEEDDDDDRRSVISSATTFPAHQMGMGIDPFTSLPHPQSPFSASHLFANEPFNLFSIAETRKPLYGSDGSFSRPETPLMREGEDGVWDTVRDNPAPFRRALSDEEKDHQDSPPASLPIDHFSADGNRKNGIEFPSTKPIDIDTSTSSIQFPIGSPEHLGTPRLQLKTRTSSHPYGEFDVATPFIRSRVQSRLEPQTFDIEPGWRTRRESTAYAQELNLASMHHLKIMLRQMLTIEEIPNIKEWEETLLRLALRIAKEMTFTSLPHRQGQDMDVRRYVKIKKIPGGKPKDSEYVTGAVITKNVAHKQMSRQQANPRVMLVTFPLEFSRVEGQYMHFGQIVRQEKEYLGNLASRIAALRPHVVLVEKSVSRLALDALARHNIAVARTVKSSAIQTIARMTQGDVFSSMDRLALEPRLGHCARYCIQTYDHPLIPGRRKTYMRFEGCNRDMGCTIILRGGNIDTLRRIKKVTRFLTFVVRNLKLETHLWKDSVISLPSDNAFAIPLSESRQLQLNVSINSLLMPSSSFSAPKLLISSPEPDKEADDSCLPVDSMEEDLPNEDAEQLRLTRRIDDSLEPYIKTFISVSATLRFPPPYPIRRMKELDNKLLEAKRAWEDEIVRKEERFQSMHRQEETLTAVTPTNGLDTPAGEERDDIFAQIEALPVLNISSAPLNADGFPPTNTVDQDSYFTLGAASPNLSDPSTPALSVMSSTFLTPEEPECLKTVADIHHQSYYTLLKWQHEEFRRIWEWYLRKNADDFVVEKYQCIHVREYTVSASDIGLHRPCFAPRITYIKFYGENDMTLGQFIEKSVNDTLTQYQDPKAICTGRGCEQPLARHCKVYVHNETSLSVAVEQWEGQIIGYPSYDLVTTWSACRVCGSATPFIPVSEEMMRYSFAKFLELHFYPADVLLVHGAGCQHNIYQHHIRFFATKGMTVRFQADSVVLHEIVYPPFRIRVRPETQLDLKNADFERLHYRNMLWYTGLIDDLKLISIDAATGDEETDARLLADINTLIMRAEAEREDISRSINETYRNTPPTDTLALNQIHAYRQDKIVAWQMDFDRLPKPRPVQNTINRNSNRSSAFDSIRSMWPRRYDLAGAFDSPHLPSSSVSEAEEVPYKSRRATTAGSAFASSASDTESSIDMNEKGEKPPTSSGLRENKETSESEVREDQPKSDPDSDSTIGAPREDVVNTETTSAPKDTEASEPSAADSTARSSRLPRPFNQNLSVADLVKKYQDFLPAQGVHDLARTAFPPKPVMSESEQEYPSQLTLRQSVRSKSRHRLPVRKASTSDFEQGYAANVAPKYLTHPRRSLAATGGSRIPAPKGSNLESQASSRRASPEKRSFSVQGKEVRFSRPSSPPGRQPAITGAKQPKPRIVSRTKDKSAPRPSSSSANKSTFRRLPSGPGTKVSNMAKHFERLGRDAERSKSRYAVIRGKRARPVASARAKVEVLDSVKDAIRDDSESSDSSSEADDEDEGNDEDQSVATTSVEKLPAKNENAPTEPASKPIPTIDLASSEHLPLGLGQEETTPSLPPPGQISVPSSPFLSATIRNKQDATLTPPPSDFELAGSGTERNSILKALSGFWPQPTRHSVEGDDPMSDPEHIFRDSSMVVRLDEPTSIIALALNSPQYRDMLAKSRAEKKTAREAKFSEGSEAFMPDDGSVGDSSSTWGVVNVDSDSADPTEDLRAPSSKLPWAITFESGGLTISCTVLYPEQFDALRRTYDCEKSMVESLSRCVKWNASGGKSGSAFLKTRDDRFIAKELSKPELQTMETFAPAYFDYMSSSVYADRPTLLAKVFGCYKLTFRKTGKDKGPGRSKSMQMNLLVMENLFYDRRFTKIYDLKGSTRNRHVQSTGRENEVLLDENLVEAAHLNPFYLREHSKRILRGALYNDSKFLSDINVMDYSLVCGVDSKNNELVIGIVDYIRTYTWDKKLESWVKESAFLGGAGRGEPTIVTPKQYRQRFISAMERYFPLIPDRWMKQRDTPEEESSVVLSELWPDW